MLEKLITNLKNSLPGPLRNKMGMGEKNEDNSDESEENELQKYESDDGPDAGEEEKKKKRVSMIIRVVLILVIGYFALDEFVLKKSGTGSGDQSPEAAIMAKNEAKALEKRKKRKEAMAKAEETKKAAAGTDTPAAKTDSTTPATAQVPDAPADSTTTASAPIENVNVLDKNDPLATAPMNTTPTTETPAEVVQTKVVDTSVDHKLDQLVDNVDQSSQSGATEEIKIPSQQETKAPKKETSMASKIVEEVTETPAPAYDQVGRGLVYNCKDKYWACVDKPAYVSCNKNMKWNKSKGGSMECVVQNIYNTDEDCAKIQKYNVSTNQPTAFCE